jgi:hypothetical protein
MSTYIPNIIQTVPKPRIYLAGKIGKNCWRHSLVPNLRGHLWANGDIVTRSFIYVGPFFASCNHCCTHQPGSHGAAGGCLVGPVFTRQDVFDSNDKALKSADLLFVYITATDCHGTLIEIGCAYRQNTRIVIAYAPGVDVDDKELWYANKVADKVYRDVDVGSLPAILATEVQNTVAIASIRRRVKK